MQSPSLCRRSCRGYIHGWIEIEFGFPLSPEFKSTKYGVGMASKWSGRKPQEQAQRQTSSLSLSLFLLRQGLGSCLAPRLLGPMCYGALRRREKAFTSGPLFVFMLKS